MGHLAYVNWVMQISKLAGNRACKERSAVFKMSICDTCGNYQYDEDYEYYVCMVDLDEDEMSRFLQGGSFECAFYQPDDEYRIVRKQM